MPCRYSCSCRIRFVRLILLAVLLFLSRISPASAQLTTAYSNFRNGGADNSAFRTEINKAALAAGLGANYFSLAETDTVVGIVQTTLSTPYQPFSINFVQNNPGGTFTTLQFFVPNPANPDPRNGALGWSNNPRGIDWRNQLGTNVADIFPENFAFTLSNAANKATNIQNLGVTIGNTAAHELGHTFGLQHYDSYGHLSITANAPNNLAATGTAQNRHVMRTSNTGYTVADSQTQARFNTLETVKLEVSNNLIANGFTPTAEQVAAHGTSATAQPLTGQLLSITGATAAVVNNASISAGGQLDFYRITVPVNHRIIANTMAGWSFINTTTPSPAADQLVTGPVDTLLQLIGSDGATVLFSNDDISFLNNSILQGPNFYNTDSLVLNYLVPQAGDFFIRVSGVGTQPTGNYELLVTLAAVPEPGTLLLIGGGLLSGGVYVWRRRRQCHQAQEATLSRRHS